MMSAQSPRPGCHMSHPTQSIKVSPPMSVVKGKQKAIKLSATVQGQQTQDVHHLGPVLMSRHANLQIYTVQKKLLKDEIQLAACNQISEIILLPKEGGEMKEQQISGLLKRNVVISTEHKLAEWMRWTPLGAIIQCSPIANTTRLMQEDLEMEEGREPREERT